MHMARYRAGASALHCYLWNLDPSWNKDTDYCTWLDELNGTSHCHFRHGIGISDRVRTRTEALISHGQEGWGDSILSDKSPRERPKW